MVKEIGLKELTNPLQSAEGLAGGGTIGAINQFATTVNELLKNGMALFQTISGQKIGSFPALNKQPQGTQQTLNPANPVQPAPIQPAAQPQNLNAESVYTGIMGLLGLLTTAKPDMSVKELVTELKTNKTQVLDGITKGMGGKSDKP